MATISVSIEELKAALAEIEGRSMDLNVNVTVNERHLCISAMDRQDNAIETMLYENGNLGAQFRCTERLMYMKDKKRS